ncbi:hypothetical protein C8R47DRAFT_1210441 [Mycena vitilis]|nr:hypothetical protein C8R47DRAFT_1210441 [Mycena vitilis]
MWKELRPTLVLMLLPILSLRIVEAPQRFVFLAPLFIFLSLIDPWPWSFPFSSPPLSPRLIPESEPAERTGPELFSAVVTASLCSLPPLHESILKTPEPAHDLYYEHRLPLGAVTNRPRFGGATRLDDFEVMALAPQVHRLARPCADPRCGLNAAPGSADRNRKKAAASRGKIQLAVHGYIVEKKRRGRVSHSAHSLFLSPPQPTQPTPPPHQDEDVYGLPDQTITFLVAFFGDAVPRFLALFSRPGVKVDDVEGASTNVGADVATDIESADSRGPLNGSYFSRPSLYSCHLSTRGHGRFRSRPRRCPRGRFPSPSLPSALDRKLFSAVVTASLCSLPPLHESILKTPEPAHDVDIGP